MTPPDARTVVPGQVVGCHNAPARVEGEAAVRRLTRAERKALQTVIHMARNHNRITDDRCAELCALVDRVSEDR